MESQVRITQLFEVKKSTSSILNFTSIILHMTVYAHYCLEKEKHSKITLQLYISNGEKIFLQQKMWHAFVMI